MKQSVLENCQRRTLLARLACPQLYLEVVFVTRWKYSDQTIYGQPLGRNQSTIVKFLSLCPLQLVKQLDDVIQQDTRVVLRHSFLDLVKLSLHEAEQYPGSRTSAGFQKSVEKLFETRTSRFPQNGDVPTDCVTVGRLRGENGRIFPAPLPQHTSSICPVHCGYLRKPSGQPRHVPCRSLASGRNTLSFSRIHYGSCFVRRVCSAQSKHQLTLKHFTKRHYLHDRSRVYVLRFSLHPQSEVALRSWFYISGIHEQQDLSENWDLKHPLSVGTAVTTVQCDWYRHESVFPSDWFSFPNKSRGKQVAHRYTSQHTNDTDLNIYRAAESSVMLDNKAKFSYLEAVIFREKDFETRYSSSHSYNARLQNDKTNKCSKFTLPTAMYFPARYVGCMQNAQSLSAIYSHGHCHAPVFTACELHDLVDTTELGSFPYRVPYNRHIRCSMAASSHHYLTAIPQRLDFSPPNKANWVQSPAGSRPDSSKLESCQMLLLVGRFSRGYPVSPLLYSYAAPFSTHLTLIGFEDLFKRRRNHATQLLSIW
ncbi:hypothetical protein PR048_014448 [Dryococelus australis]|uniref:Uncharacterized protein n=1 Tax=Dryococelus australis TaxID=614101 RepID=A0ABQ9HEM9_9NEOP|nr:hypothetical protein PR048_014448 [Dryococelus australis]